MRAEGSDHVEHLVLNMKRGFVVITRFGSAPEKIAAMTFRHADLTPEGVRRHLAALLT